MVNIGFAAAGLVFLYKRRRLCLGLLRYPAREHAVSWRSEVWPFQWKIAVSWACLYFSGQVLVPTLFAYRGPREAGQFGMSLGIATYLSVLMISWMSTKATPFGQMIARGEYPQIRRLFFRTLRQALSVFLALATICEMAMVALFSRFPRLAGRMVSPRVFALLLLASMSFFIVQSMSVYLRSFKREPFLAQSIVIAVSTVLLSFLTMKWWGSYGAALVFLLCTGIFGLVSGSLVFSRWTRSVCGGVPIQPRFAGEHDLSHDH